MRYPGLTNEPRKRDATKVTIHPRFWHRKLGEANPRCARCGRPISHRAAASTYYGSASGYGLAPVVRVSGYCCCLRPDPVPNRDR